MATSAITSQVNLAFNEYKWLWATLTVREIFKSTTLFSKTVRTLNKYDGLPYSPASTTGKNFHDDLMALDLKDDNGNNISFVDPANRSFLRGYQTYWTNTGVLIPPSLNNNKISVTPLGKALATGKISHTEYIKILASRFQFPSLVSQYPDYEEWLNNNLVFKPCIRILQVLIELYKQGGISNSYITEQETAVLIVPLIPTMTPSEIANEIIAWREGDSSFNFSFLYIGFATNSNVYRNIKEFLQILSIGEFLINNKMKVKDFNLATSPPSSKISTSNCYFLNTFTKGKWGQSISSLSELDKIEEYCNESENGSYFMYNRTLTSNVHKLRFINYLGDFPNSSLSLPTISNPEIDAYISLLKTHKQLIFSGAPGIGKTRMAMEIARKLDADGELAIAETILFHQASSYEDFIEGIRPSIDSQQLSYSYKTGTFKLLCEKAKADSDKYFLIIIDEINRGNISSIFGELILLLEPSYRKQEYQVELQYTGDYFWIPENVLIIGTMNSIDKSAVELDMALRRRFKFIQLQPSSKVIEEELAKLSISLTYPDGSVIDISKVHENLNELIAEDNGLGEDFCIGHSFFLPNPNVEYDEQFLLDVWNFSLIPLLNEYIIISPRFKSTLTDRGFLTKRRNILEFDLPNMYRAISQISR